MQELRLARREGDDLVVTSDAGDEFRITIDEYVISEVKQVARTQRSGPRVKPREIQALIRSGKTRSEVVEATGADESDVERHEGPVLAERRYILDSAHAVPVRAQSDTSSDESDTFGAVITSRLTGLGAEDIEWTAWRDAETGWMISLDFTSRDVAHRAVWTFEHRKSLLAPLTSDAVTLSQQGDVGDRLIPKLRAVDSPERADRFDSGTFDPEELAAALPAASPPDVTLPLDFDDVANESGAEPEESAESAYDRRQEINQRAISTRADVPTDFGETADLLDALRRRRGERESARPEPSEAAASLPRLHNASGRAEGPSSDTASDQAESSTVEAGASPVTGESLKPSLAQSSHASTTAKSTEVAAESGVGSKKRRTSIPSWDDILFGTRSEDDPA